MDERTGQRSQTRLGNGNQGAGAGKNQISAPSISLSKGGGAIRGIGEKFAANPVTGTGSMTVPIATSPGRSGFGPQLALSYDSGAGNGPFGFGWTLSLPSITRKTDKGLPKYLDAEESDVFILSGAEDLVPALELKNGAWVRTSDERTLNGESYLVHLYRPRIEGLFARIERWTRKSDGDAHWRSISKDNITTFYGKTSESRIADPDDSNHVFSWLICESYDDKGNAILYSYKEEDDKGIDLAQPNEHNRTTETRKVNRYLKTIRYGNTKSHVDPAFASRDAWRQATQWLFEIVFDYGEGHYQEQQPDTNGNIFAQAALGLPPSSSWPVRQDPFSSYRADFEVRTYRLCQRALMFHHFPDELDTPDCLVRSTEFTYSQSPIASFITQVTQSGYVRQPNGTYLKKSLPPLSFEYTQPTISEEIQVVDPASLENLPAGADGLNYQWLDLDGEGLQGVLSEQQDGWYYKRNLSPISVVKENGKEKVVARFEPLVQVSAHPSIAEGMGARHQFLDLAGDGQLDLIQFETPVSGFFERTHEEYWDSFVPFESVPNLAWNDSNLKLIDLTGDGHADILITEHDALVWYPSLAEEGFGSAIRIPKPRDEEEGPAVVFADGTQAVFVADISGDGLTDIVRIRNGEVCYWPNLGYGRFGKKITMDNAPWFERSEIFDPRRIRLADIDGSGVTDIIYLGSEGVRLYFNESGNGWSNAKKLTVFPRVDSLTSVQAVDLLGNGTACLVWTSPLPRDARQPMRYIDLMGGQKPHLLVKTVNNLGAETVVQYAPSTKFYLQDKRDGKPWITRLPFPVHVVERVQTYDHISRNRFVTRYEYHHGYFDGVEREFRGFGRVDQLDTEEFAALRDFSLAPAGGEGQGEGEPASNIEEASHVPPVLTKTWFHTGAYIGRDHVSDFFAGLLDGEDKGEYYREPGLSDAQAKELLLPDTVMPPDLTVEEEREACRALKGSMLRQEVYALDGTDKAEHPYTVTEQNFSIRRLQPRDGNRYGVFFAHPLEAISYHYERNPADPRVSHALTLEVDDFGNVLKSAAIGYGRRPGQSPLQGDDLAKQEQLLITYTENDVTNAVEEPDDYRAPLPCESRAYELTGYMPTGAAGRYQHTDFVRPDPNDPKRLVHIFDSEIDYEDKPTNDKQRRLIEHLRTFYQPDDLGVAQNDPLALLPLRTVQPMALPGESYKLAFTPGLLDQVYVRNGQTLLLANPADVLEGGGADRGGYGDPDGDGHWWIPSGRVFYSPDADDTAAQELAEAQSNFFVARRYQNPFGNNTTIDYDSPADPNAPPYDLLVTRTLDPLGNEVRAENDYRVLQPTLVTDPNGNQSDVTFDALGLVVGTAVMGKPGQNVGDLLDDDFQTDLTQEEITEFFDAIDPHDFAPALLGNASTRILYDIDRFRRLGEPPFAATLARETHFFDPGGAQRKIQVSFSYSDGFGREIQKKIQAEPGPVVENGPIVDPRWVGNGCSIFNNKGKPVRQYEPFFSNLPNRRHQFEFARLEGVSPILFYDPVERVVATLHPNHTYEKVVFDPWQQTTWDVNDTASHDPRTNQDVSGYVAKYFEAQPADWTTWLRHRIDPDNPPQDSPQLVPDQAAAVRTLKHANTPTITHFDALGRPFLTIADNGVDENGERRLFETRVELDIEGNQREVIDARGRIVMTYDYDMLGNRIHQVSMDAGARWMLNDVSGKPIRAWDSRAHSFRNEYDELRRPLHSFVKGADPQDPSHEILFGRMIYGDGPNTGLTADEILQANLRGKAYKQYDGAGIVTNEVYDFKGNLERSTRRLVTDYKSPPDWSQNPALENDTFRSSTVYDALNRPTQLIAPHSDQPGTTVNVIEPIYNEANLLEQVHAWLNRNTEPVGWLDPVTANLHAVTDIDYDAKGQRTLIDYGNGVRTTYEYDPLTFRLVHLLTRRNGIIFPDDCPEPPPIGWPGCQVQNLHYTYDPAGNITHIRDDAQQTIYFDNRRVEPSNDYFYDAIYRLISATGREHLGQTNGQPNPPTPPDWSNAFHMNLPHPGDGNAMGTYVEEYTYDEVGNISEIRHRGLDPVHPGWPTRTYNYNEPSLIEPEKQNNRLTNTTVGNNNPLVEQYVYDAHGNMVRMPHLGGAHPDPNMHWDHKDQLRQADLGGGGEAYYVYDAAGQRVRKVVEKNNGALIEERIYLGGFEIFRRRNGSGIALERETLHIMDEKQRIALVETRTQGDDGSPEQLIRYQFGNHLGSASLELDESGEIISYEEYYPYGSTSYQAVRSEVEVSPKRYRYTGKERDEESGLYYHGARYYAPWLGRWVSCDPAGMVDGLNLYRYVTANPVQFLDPSGKQSAPTLEELQAYVDPAVVQEILVGGGDIGDVIEYLEGIRQQIRHVSDPHRDLAAESIAQLDAQEEYEGRNRVIQAPPRDTVQEFRALRDSGVSGSVQYSASRLADVPHETALLQAQGVGQATSLVDVFGQRGAASDAAVARIPDPLGTFRDARGVLRNANGTFARDPRRTATASGSSTRGSLGGAPGTRGRRWRVGDPHDALTAAGRAPSWSTVRSRYWRNRAAAAERGEFSRVNLLRMGRGRAPLDSTGRPIELEHIVPQRTGAPGRHRDLLEVTRVEHGFFDRYVHITDATGRKAWKYTHLGDTRP
ncbi:MAG: toxin [Deltaproteobacteria bacterium]|nr:toxin [Deltaproteobacteria bacterium]